MSSVSKNINKDLSKNLLAHYKPQSKIIKKVDSLIQSNQKFLLTTHIDSDPDGVGSQIGLYYLLKKLKKKCWILNNEPPPAIFSEIGGYTLIDHIQNYEVDVSRLEEKVKDHFVFILDSSEFKRSAKVAELIERVGCSWASIDHHLLAPNKRFCNDDSYAATCEFVWDLYHYYKIQIQREAAFALYAGLSADSGNFRYEKTTMRTHLAGGELISHGIPTDKIYRLLYENQPVDRLYFLKKVLESVIINKKLKYAVAEVLPKTKKGLDLGPSPKEGLVNLLISVQGVQIAVLMSQTDEGYLKCSMRSIEGANVAQIASLFGGGGHRNAAGLKIEEPYKKARKKVIYAVHNYLKNYQ